MTKQLTENPIPTFTMAQIHEATTGLYQLMHQSCAQYQKLVHCAFEIANSFKYKQFSMFWGDDTFNLPPLVAYINDACPDKFFNVFSEAYELDLKLYDDQYRDLVGYVLHEVLEIVNTETPLQAPVTQKLIWTTVECCSCYEMIKSRLVQWTDWQDPVCPTCNQ